MHIQKGRVSEEVEPSRVSLLSPRGGGSADAHQQRREDARDLSVFVDPDQRVGDVVVAKVHRGRAHLQARGAARRVAASGWREPWRAVGRSARRVQPQAAAARPAGGRDATRARVYKTTATRGPRWTRVKPGECGYTGWTPGEGVDPEPLRVHPEPGVTPNPNPAYNLRPSLPLDAD